MIYTASYFQPHHHHGALVPISRSIPPGLKDKVKQGHPLQDLLAPSADLLQWWKRQEQRHNDMGWGFPSEVIEAQYIDRYRDEIKSVLPKIKEYLASIDPTQHETWLCWEAPGEFCHRNLAFTLVEKYRPDCIGGQDTVGLGKQLQKSNDDEFGLGDLVALKCDRKSIFMFVREIPPSMTWDVSDNPYCLLSINDEIKCSFAWWLKKQLIKVTSPH